MAMPTAIRLAGVYALLALSTAIAAPDDVTRMERAVELRVDDGQFMGAVLVARDGTVVLSKGYGKANLEWLVANSPTTKFRLGSVTKQFTAACILLLEERAKLKTDDPVKKYIADAPAVAGIKSRSPIYSRTRREYRTIRASGLQIDRNSSDDAREACVPLSR